MHLNRDVRKRTIHQEKMGRSYTLKKGKKVGVYSKPGSAEKGAIWAAHT